MILRTSIIIIFLRIEKNLDIHIFKNFENFVILIIFQKRFMNLYKEDADKLGENFATKEELIEFTNDVL